MRRIAVILQIICIFVGGVGIGIEIRYQADAGFVLITLSSVLWAVSEKIMRLSDKPKK